MSQKASATLGVHDRLSPPVVRLQPVSDMGVHRGAGTGTLIIVAGRRSWVAQLDVRNEPVPVQQGDVVVVARRRMPAQEVVVVEATARPARRGGGYCDNRLAATVRGSR